MRSDEIFSAHTSTTYFENNIPPDSAEARCGDLHTHPRQLTTDQTILAFWKLRERERERKSGRKEDNWK